ncbi:DUF1906 domain-containing protein [Skermania piniformis]|uniref:DUF1906 domain-containing protein n=1 Tax=Skermania pinensis TaxID=39122 RepID=A0ABX8S7D5_9ACTN|nr:DUF1906 domain-containing protein [Skermania piniformis]QXQ13176.1 DUF1906 domain-containing protein [Skermania piniformis]
MRFSRRELLRGAAGTVALGMTAWAVPRPPVAAAKPDLGTIIDYSRGVPAATAIAEAGYTGVIRYVSDRRPGAEWMLGKPLKSDEVAALREADLEIVSCYQFGKGPTADWRAGREAGRKHATRGLELHRAAGGPDNTPIYASIDDNPSDAELAESVAPYIAGWVDVLGADRTGVYANSPTIDHLLEQKLGTWFWQHDWGTPDGYVHPKAHLHQFEIDQRDLDGVRIDRNKILQADYGQWSLA